MTSPRRLAPGAGVDLSIVVPAHNSAALIERTILRIAARVADRTAEIIVVENGSSDGTFQVCQRIAAGWPEGPVGLHVLQSPKGMGCALRMGARSSHGAAVLLTADDLPFGFDDLDAADRLATSEEAPMPAIIIGSKARPESEVDRGVTRAVLGAGFSLLRRLILHTRVGDSQGTLLVNGELLRRLVPHLLETGFLFTTELVYVAERLGLRPLEVPVRLELDHRDHPSRVSVSDIASMAIGLIRIRRRHGSRPLRMAPGA